MAATPGCEAARAAGHGVGVVRAGVVDDGDEGAEGEGLVEEGAQRGDPLRQLRGLVVDGHDDLDVHRDPAGVDVGFEGGQGCHGGHGGLRVSGLREGRLWPGVKSRRRAWAVEAQTTVPVGLSTGNGRPPRVGAPAQQRDPNGDRHALARGGAGRDRPAVGSHDGGDDRQPETAAAARPRPGRVGAVEALEDAAGLLVGHAGAAVAHLDLAPGRRPASTRTVVAVPGGVCARTLASRLSTTWRSRSLSPVTSTGRAAQNRTGQSGPTAVAVRTASDGERDQLDRCRLHRDALHRGGPG